MKNLSLIGVLAVTVFLSSIVCAEEYPYIYKGFRPMGMGGAFVAVSDDGNALFYNPAGLTDVPEQRVTLLSVEAEVTRGGLDAYKDFRDTDFDDTDETVSFLRDYIGEYNHAAASVFPHIERPNFAFGIYGTQKTTFAAHNYQFPELEISNIGDAGVAAGYARPFLDGALSLGANAKFNLRKSLYRTYSLPEITAEGFEDRLDDDAEDGAGVLLDLGAIYRIGAITMTNGRKINAQAGLCVSNLIGSSMGDAEDLPVHVDAGFALKTEPLIFAIDYVDIFEGFDQDSDIPKRIRYGVEYVYNQTYALRAGYYEGYFTLGAGISTKNVQIDVLTYAEELGEYSGQIKDRRYAFRLAVGF